MAQIIERQKDKRYLVKIYLGRDNKGKRLYHSKTITGTKKDAQKYARGKEHERDIGTLRKPLRLTLNDFLDTWLNHRRRNVREQTHIHYESLMRRYVRPFLGEARLTDLRALDFEDLYFKLEQQGLSGRTIRHTHARLQTAFNQAVKWGQLGHNQVALATAPRIVKRERDYLRPEEAQRFTAATYEDSRLGVLLRLALFTGLRPEEYCGLRWSDLDLENSKRGMARVRQVVKWFVGRRRTFEDPKTEASKRRVYFPVSLGRELQEHRRVQLEERLRSGQHYQALDLVFADKTGQPLNLSQLTYHHMWPALDRADVRKMSLYALRHSYVTLSLLSGVSPKAVSEQAGHTSVEFTLDNYGHVLPEERELASDQLETLIFEASGNKLGKHASGNPT